MRVVVTGATGKREPRHASIDAIRDVLSGIADAEGEPTPPLEVARR